MKNEIRVQPSYNDVILKSHSQSSDSQVPGPKHYLEPMPNTGQKYWDEMHGVGPIWNY